MAGLLVGAVLAEVKKGEAVAHCSSLSLRVSMSIYLETEYETGWVGYKCYS